MDDNMKSFPLRMVRMSIGIFLFSLGIILTIKANIGYAPWEVFHVGLSITTGLSLGLISIIVGLLLLIIVIACGEKFGLGTILNMVFIGILIDIKMALDFIPLMDNLISGIIMLIAGLFSISLGSYFYIGTGFGAGPRDNLMVVLARKTRLPAGVCRSAVELIVTVSGWFLGGMVGIGTIISVVGIGFCIQITFKLLRFDVTAVKHETLLETYKTLFRKNT